MPVATVTWTIVPAGINPETGRLKASAVPSIRLTDGARLGDFDPVFREWPTYIMGTGFSVIVDGQEVGAEIVPKLLPDGTPLLPNQELWNLLFSALTPVEPFVYQDLRQARLFSYPVTDALQFLKGVYQEVGAVSPEEFPDIKNASITPLSDLIDQVGRLTAQDDDSQSLEGIQSVNLAGYSEATAVSEDGLKGSFDHGSWMYHELNYQSTTPTGARGLPSNGMPRTPASGQVPNGPNSKATVDFNRARRFYRRPENHRSYPYEPVASDSSTPEVPKLDFHSVLGILSDYPSLQRLFGLVIDLEFEDPGMAGSGEVFMRTDEVSETHYSRTFYRSGGPLGFYARSRPEVERIEDGMLRLDQPEIFDLVQVDVDSATQRNLSFASSAYRRINGWKGAEQYHQDPSMLDPRESLPSLRTAGMCVVKINRAYELGQDVFESGGRNDMLATGAYETTTPFYAEDLLAGYRVDVLDEARGRWFSLCERDGRYRFNDDPSTDLVIPDEGFVRVSAASAASDDQDEDIYLHDTIFQWDGWSLVAERPGNTLVANGTEGEFDPNANYEQSKRVDQQNPTDFKLETFFVPQKGSLPLLRFGNSYQLRARAVDIAGNSFDVAEDHATRADVYRRYEPVNPPALMPRAPYTEAESVERMVIRSDFDRSTDDYVSDEVTQEATANYIHTYQANNDRHFIPPKTAQQTAEFHGGFDQYMGAGKPHQQGMNIARKEQGTLYDKQIIDTSTGTFSIFENDLEVVSLPTADPSHEHFRDSIDELHFPDGTPIRGIAIAPGQYVINRGDIVELPYLPDVIASAARFKTLPGTTGAYEVSYNNSFPDADPFLLRIVEGPEGTPPSMAGRTLTVALPKAEIRKVKYSSLFDPSRLEELGMWEWIRERSGLQFEPIVLAGDHWMVTPHRTITLVHAVQRPLKPATFDYISATKSQIGQTNAFLRGSIDFDLRSTGRVDFYATWNEPIDDVSQSLPEDGRAGRPIEIGGGRVLELPFEPFYGDMEKVAFPIPSNLEVADQPGATPKNYPHPDPKTPQHYLHEFGDTKYRRVKYRMRATTRFRDYFPPEIYNDPDNISRVGEEFEVDVKSSARPAAPEVLYVVPTWGWEEKNVGTSKVSRRCGGGLRVYLKRGWYSSGEGELLGVVLRAPNASSSGGNPSGTLLNPPAGVRRGISDLVFQNNADDPLRTLVTRWGMDPIWEAEPTPENYSVNHFPEAVESIPQGLTLAELPSSSLQRVGVAGHQVHFDEERKLWYADITVDLGESYYPFIRLAVCRFQPNSMANAHLSRVILTDFIQTVPDRVAAVTWKTSTIQVAISGVHGLSKSSFANEYPPPKIGQKNVNPAVNFTRRMIATLEKQDSGGGWLPAGEATTDVLLEPFEEVGNKVIWMGNLTAPGQGDGGGIAQAPPGSINWRVAVREVEAIDKSGEHRVVYADTIPVEKP